MTKPTTEHWDWDWPHRSCALKEPHAPHSPSVEGESTWCGGNNPEFGPSDQEWRSQSSEEWQASLERFRRYWFGPH